MKQRSIEIATFALFLLPLLLILVNPTISSQAMGLDGAAARSESAPSQATFYGMGGMYVNWVLESGEFTGIGGLVGPNPNYLITLGDDNKNRQYRGILSYDTALLPSTASIQSAAIYFVSHGVMGISPFVWGDLKADIKSGFFGSSKYVQIMDFQAAASFPNAGTRAACPDVRTCSIPLSARAFPYINRSGLTQFRVRFAPDDNNNRKSDIYYVFGGAAAPRIMRPTLVVKYYP